MRTAKECNEISNNSVDRITNIEISSILGMIERVAKDGGFFVCVSVPKHVDVTKIKRTFKENGYYVSMSHENGRVWFTISWDASSLKKNSILKKLIRRIMNLRRVSKHSGPPGVIGKW